MAEGLKNPYGNAADEHFGYVFGVDGLMSPDAAGEFLDVSGRQLDRYAAAGNIRKGLLPGGRRRFCKRSIVQFVKGLEK